MSLLSIFALARSYEKIMGLNMLKVARDTSIAIICVN